MYTLRKFWGFRPWTKHSQILIVAGLVYFIIGVAYFRSTVSPERLVALSVALRWMSIQGWGVVFMLVGMMAIISARWPPFAEKWGYMAMTGLSSGWASVYACGIIFGDSPMQTLTTVLLWGLVGFMWWGISGLLNPHQVAGRDGLG